MVGETLNPPGGWSSYPPHKHDVDDPPREAIYEEVYFFRIQPEGGFGIQRVYERREGADALNEVLVVEDGDTVIIPRGYHPVVAAPGYQLSYVWALRGEGRRYGAWSDDPAHALAPQCRAAAEHPLAARGHRARGTGARGRLRWMSGRRRPDLAALFSLRERVIVVPGGTGRWAARWRAVSSPRARGSPCWGAARRSQNVWRRSFARWRRGVGRRLRCA